MVLKTGNIVSHAGALEWGAGKVLEVTATLATIQFSDGKNRKIAASHFAVLQPATPGSFTPPPDMPIEAKTKAKTSKAATSKPKAAAKKKAVAPPAA